jgi:hypothetical protein
MDVYIEHHSVDFNHNEDDDNLDHYDFYNFN